MKTKNVVKVINEPKLFIKKLPKNYRYRPDGKKSIRLSATVKHPDNLHHAQHTQLFPIHNRIVFIFVPLNPRNRRANLR